MKKQSEQQFPLLDNYYNLRHTILLLRTDGNKSVPTIRSLSLFHDHSCYAACHDTLNFI